MRIIMVACEAFGGVVRQTSPLHPRLLRRDKGSCAAARARLMHGGPAATNYRLHCGFVGASYSESILIIGAVGEGGWYFDVSMATTTSVNGQPLARAISTHSRRCSSHGSMTKCSYQAGTAARTQPSDRLSNNEKSPRSSGAASLTSNDGKA